MAEHAATAETDAPEEAMDMAGAGGSTGASDAGGGAPSDVDGGSTPTRQADAAMGSDNADGGVSPAAGDPTFDGSGNSPCVIATDSARCDSQPIMTITNNGADPRRIYWARPASVAPEAGFPAVVLFQGSIYGPSNSWNVALPKDTPFGGYYQVALIALLVDNGFVVVQPEAAGGLAWNTNNGGNYDSSADSVFIPKLLDELTKGSFGPVDVDRLYATGISSGGYMTSRMAVSYAGTFRALAIQSGSYATCLGPLCNVPDMLPADHPPTLLLHGTVDGTVPISTARAYETKLKSAGIETRFVEDATAGHQWLDVAPVEITRWFLDH